MALRKSHPYEEPQDSYSCQQKQVIPEYIHILYGHGLCSTTNDHYTVSFFKKLMWCVLLIVTISHLCIHLCAYGTCPYKVVVECRAVSVVRSRFDCVRECLCTRLCTACLYRADIRLYSKGLTAALR